MRTLADLRTMRDDLADRYFGGQGKGLRINWGRAPALSRHEWACYWYTERRIQLQDRCRSLDVPEFFVEFLVYHEMLHHFVWCVREGRRLVTHTAIFTRLEREYEFYPEAKKYLDTHYPSGT